MNTRITVSTFVALALLTSCTQSEPAPTSVTPTPIACTEEAKICPDGSSVGRVGPSCEFAACPTVLTGSTLSGSTASGETSSVTRTETVSYVSPASPTDMIELSVTVTDGVITQAIATPRAEHEVSLKLQQAFADGVSQAAIGKKAADLDLDVIGGASLTTAAFEQFVRSF